MSWKAKQELGGRGSTKVSNAFIKCLDRKLPQKFWDLGAKPSATEEQQQSLGEEPLILVNFYDFLYNKSALLGTFRLKFLL